MWEIDIKDQILTFLYSILLGFILCILYDVFRSLRKALPHGRVAVFFEDILFFSISAVITFLFLLARTGGGLRGYVFVGVLAGFVAFRLTLSRLIYYLLSTVFGAVYRFSGFINGKIADFIEWFGQKMLLFFMFLAQKIKKGAKTLKKLLKSGMCLLYTKRTNEQI